MGSCALQQEGSHAPAQHPTPGTDMERGIVNCLWVDAQRNLFLYLTKTDRIYSWKFWVRPQTIYFVFLWPWIQQLMRSKPTSFSNRTSSARCTLEVPAPYSFMFSLVFEPDKTRQNSWAWAKRLGQIDSKDRLHIIQETEVIGIYEHRDIVQVSRTKFSVIQAFFLFAIFSLQVSDNWSQKRITNITRIRSLAQWGESGNRKIYCQPATI
jgi:hypothetical protein